MAFLNTEYKRIGLKNQKKVLNQFISYLTTKNFIIQKTYNASFYADTQLKYDYIIQFDKSTPFLNKELLYVDVKFAKTYTVFDSLGNSILNKSKAHLTVMNIPSIINPSLLSDTFIMFLMEDFKQLLKKYPAKIYHSKSDASYFFYILDYQNRHSDYIKKIRV
jgi:hypothetical protein